MSLASNDEVSERYLQIDDALHRSQNEQASVKLYNAVYTKTGQPKYDATSELYASDPIPPLKILTQQKKVPYELQHNNEMFDIHFWDSIEFPTFHELLQNALNLNDGDVVWYTKVYRKKIKDFHDFASDYPSLNNFFEVGDKCIFKPSVRHQANYSEIEAPAGFECVIIQDSTSFKTGDRNERSTGFIAFRLTQAFGF